MNERSENLIGNEPRILLYSQRNLFSSFHYRLGLYEFEDVICQVESVDLLAPRPKEWFKYGERIAMKVARTFNAGINPGVPITRVKKEYDLFFVVVQFPRDLMQIKYVEGWKDHCKKSICWLNEIWVPDIANSKYYLEILSQFDYVIIQWIGSVEPVQKVVKKECLYLPYGIDAILFCPYPNAPRRVIDIYSIGRRSEITHGAILKMAKEAGLFYVYDTIIGDQVKNPAEHRLLFSNMAKRSRYFVVNPGKVDNFDETAGQVEFGNRFFEGAASGTIMIGETPENDKFRVVFDWNDAVIHLPYDSEEVDSIIKELDKNPERQERIRKDNVIHSLLRHDWVYRWEAILKTAGLEPLSELVKRKERLSNLADIIEEEVGTY